MKIFDEHNKRFTFTKFSSLHLLLHLPLTESVDDGRIFPHSGTGQVIPEVCLVGSRLDEDTVLTGLAVRLVGVPVGVVRLRPALLPDEQPCGKLVGGANTELK